MPIMDTYGQLMLTQEQFRDELGSTVRVAINQRIIHDATNDELPCAQLQDFKDWLNSTLTVNREDPSTIDAVDTLLSLGMITQQVHDDLLYVTPAQPLADVPCPNGWVAAHLGSVPVWAIQMQVGQSVLLTTGDMCAYPDYRCMVIAGGDDCLGVVPNLTID